MHMISYYVKHCWQDCLLHLCLSTELGLTHWGRVTHICVSKLTIIGSNNGLSPGRRQALIWTNAGILSIGPLGINFSEMLIKVHTFSFKKMRLQMSSGKWRPSCLGLNVLITIMGCHDIMVNCLPNHHNRHPIAGVSFMSVLLRCSVA